MQKLTDELRLQIINDFLTLNVPLHDIVLNMKRKVVHVMAADGLLGGIVDANPDNPDDWLAVLYRKLDPLDHQLIMDALYPLMKFDMSTENFLIYRVRRCLYPIDWSLMDQPPQLFNGLTDRDALVEEIDNILRSSLENVRRGIDKELDEFYSFPNTAVFAAFHDFYDRAAVSDEEGMSVKDQWTYLYEDKIPMIWPEEHQAYAAAAGQAEEWRVLTEDIGACAEDKYFLIEMKEG